MTTALTRQSRRALTLIEVLVVFALLTVVTVAVVLPQMARTNARPKRTACINNLKQLGLGLRIYANDHEDKFPWQTAAISNGTIHLVNSPQVFRHFLAMSNELNTPKVLVCPEDREQTGRKVVTEFAKLSNANLSYFLGLSASESCPNDLLSGDRNITGGTLINGFLRTITTNSVVGWTKEIHRSTQFGHGNAGLADGSALQLTSTQLSNVVVRALQSNAVIRLGIP
jgi:type II secretory pathway pseudopilin PulG